MSEFKIEKDVEMPVQKRRTHRYPFASMEVGDSFLTTEPKQLIQPAASAAGRYSDKKFVTRAVQGGIRVWRVE